jgi:UDP-N-acetylglucosamine 4,6-dehydratase/5-epimerase
MLFSVFDKIHQKRLCISLVATRETLQATQKLNYILYLPTINTKPIGVCLKKTVFITGGSGFLGRHLAKKLAADFKVIIGARNNKQNKTSENFTNCESCPIDVSNIESVRDAFREYKPDIVIHAAATKFVDLAETKPMECIDVNVVGSQNVARVAIECGVESVIGISTDKSAPPVRNTYGLSKAIMERLFCAMNGKSETKFACVRYGNVAWSTGSVLPIWSEMFEKNAVLQTTGPEMRRFFFTVDEAVELVLTAMSGIKKFAGKVLCREMKASKMQDIIEVWVEAKGGSWEVISGRPGERNDEYLIGDLELDYTEELVINKVRHFIISFNDKVKTPLTNNLSSANATKLSKNEILDLINYLPLEKRG